MQIKHENQMRELREETSKALSEKEQLYQIKFTELENMNKGQLTKLEQIETEYQRQVEKLGEQVRCLQSEIANQKEITRQLDAEKNASLLSLEQQGRERMLEE